jgi:hypothetical protein
MRPVLTLLLGLAIGAAGVILIRGSFPPPAGTPEARILELENELRDTRLRLAKIDPAQARPREDTGHALGRGVREALADLKAGRPVNINQLFNATKPLLRDLSPLFDNIRRRDERRRFDHLAGEYARKYDLNPDQQKALRQWLTDRSEKNAELFKAVVLSDHTRLDDLVKATRDHRHDDGMDGFMATQIGGEKLETFRRDRLTERAERVQSEADMKVQRLHGTVDLDETQQDQVFSIMARSSRDFDPQMQIEGVSADASPGADRDAAIMAVLRPDQRQRYSEWQAERRASAEANFAEIGLQMPEGWDVLEED